MWSLSLFKRSCASSWSHSISGLRENLDMEIWRCGFHLYFPHPSLSSSSMTLFRLQSFAVVQASVWEKLFSQTEESIKCQRAHKVKCNSREKPFMWAFWACGCPLVRSLFACMFRCRRCRPAFRSQSSQHTRELRRRAYARVCARACVSRRRVWVGWKRHLSENSIDFQTFLTFSSLGVERCFHKIWIESSAIELWNKSF